MEPDNDHIEDKHNIGNAVVKIFSKTSSSNKFSQYDWQATEKKLSKFDQNVITCLINVGNGNNFIVKQEYFVIGDKLYIENRNLLKTQNPLVFGCVEIICEDVRDEKKGKKHGPKNGIKKESADDIRIKNTKRKVTEMIESALKSFVAKDFQPYQAFNSETIEIKGIGLLYSACYLYTNKDKFVNKTKYLPFVFSIMVAIQRFTNTCNGFEGKSIVEATKREYVSDVLINDLKYWLAELLKIYPKYNGFAIYDYAPELLVCTPHDKAIPTAGVKPRKHQIELMKCVSENFDKGFMIVYNPMIGAGKTTTIVSLASKLQILKIAFPDKYADMQIIFACNLESVKGQAANICYNGEIKFGIASKDKNGYHVTNHFSCKQDDERLVIVTSPEIAMEILMDKSNNDSSNKFILYLDEPTIGADIIGSNSLKTNMGLMTVMPKRIILSSATFPDLPLITDITKFFTNKYGGAEICTVYSDEIQIGCDVKTYDGNYVVPHLGINTSNDLQKAISAIHKCPFLGRVYTPNIVKTLFLTMKDLNIGDVPNISELFSNVDNMSSDKVRQIAMEMLNILSKQNDKIITKVCSSEIMSEKEDLNMEDDEVKEQKKEVFLWVTEDNTVYDNVEDPLDFSKIGTIQTWRLQNTTLVATTTPVEFARSIFSDLLKDIYNAPIDSNLRTNLDSEIISKYKSSSNAIGKYKRDLELHEKQKIQIERNNNDQDKLSRMLQDFDESAPKIKFPQFGQINTLEHLKKYAKPHISKIIGRFVRPLMTLETLPFGDTIVPDDILTLLFAGVGIYVHEHIDIDDIYLKTVLSLASEGKLAFIIADSSICYGTNYPINRVIIVDDFANKHSINTLFQLMGRAGRVGKSWVAEAYVSNMTAKRIIGYTRDSSEAKLEADNMVTEFENVIREREHNQNRKVEELLQKYTKPKEEKKKEGVIIISTNKKNAPPKKIVLDINNQLIKDISIEKSKRKTVFRQYETENREQYDKQFNEHERFQNWRQPYRHRDMPERPQYYKQDRFDNHRSVTTQNNNNWRNNSCTDSVQRVQSTHTTATSWRREETGTIPVLRDTKYAPKRGNYMRDDDKKYIPAEKKYTPNDDSNWRN